MTDEREKTLNDRIELLNRRIQLLNERIGLLNNRIVAMLPDGIEKRIASLERNAKR